MSAVDSGTLDNADLLIIKINGACESMLLLFLSKTNSNAVLMNMGMELCGDAGIKVTLYFPFFIFNCCSENRTRKFDNGSMGIHVEFVFTS